jgi:hypothetical protein
LQNKIKIKKINSKNSTVKKSKENEIEKQTNYINHFK